MSIASMAGMGGANQIASLFVKVGADARQFESAMGGVERRLGVVGGAVTKFGALAAGVAVGGIAAVGAGLTMALKSSAEFEKVMSGAGAVLGASADQMERLNDLALQLGKDTAFSAAAAAGAIEMLAKNGVNAEQILGGMADATVALAAATGANLSTAADVATDAMMQFGLSTSQVSQAINGISGVVVNSKFDINDYALALSQGGGVAAKVGVSFDDFNATIAAISSAFGSGSDAGTSFKVFLQRLVPQSKEAASTMAQLGLMAADGSNAFFDASGNMKSMADIAGLLQSAFGGLSDAARIDALSTIFGTDAMRAAATLAEVGTKRFNEIADAMSKVDAAGQAAKRLDNLAGDVEQLGGSFETLKIKLGQAFTPLARKGVQFLTKNVNKLIDGVTSLVKGFQKMRGSVGGLLRPFAGPLKDLLTQFKTGFALGFDKADFSGPVKGIFTGLVDMWLSAERWMLGTGLPALMTTLGRWGSALVAWVAPQIPVLLAKLGELWQGITSWITDGEKRTMLLTKLGDWAGAFTDWASGVKENIEPSLSAAFTSIKDWIKDPAKRTELAATLKDKWTAFTDWASGVKENIEPPLSAAFTSIKDWIKDPAKRAETFQTLKDKWTGFTDWASGVWTWAEPPLSAAFTSIKDWIKDPAKRAETFQTLKDKWTGFTDWASGVWTENIEPFLSAAFTSIKDWIKDPAKPTELAATLKDKWTGFQDWAGDIWADITPKLNEMATSIKTWIDTNAPPLGTWIDAFLGFTSKVKRDFEAEWPKIESIFKTNGTAIVGHIQGIIDKLGQLARWPGSDGVTMGVNFAKIFSGLTTVVTAMALAVTSSIDALLGAVVTAFQAMEKLKTGDVGGYLQTWKDGLMGVGAALAALQGTALGDIAKWIDPLYWLGIRPESTGAQGGNMNSGVFGASSMQGIPIGSGGGTTININVDPGTIPTDRSKLQELARAIWREAEMSGLRL
jgi:TP901 family phage tail tape measure protein